MIASFSVSNFGPFSDRIEFSTFAESKKKELLDQNTFIYNNQHLNKVTYFYGSNSSGKSNLFRAVNQMQKYISLSPIIASNNPQIMELTHFKDDIHYNVNYFKYNESYANLPTTFSVGVIVDGALYTYSFSVMQGNIVHEVLTRKIQRTETILERTSPDYREIVLKSELKSFSSHLPVVKKNVLCLSMASFLNNELAVKVIEAITDIDVINMASVAPFRYDESKSSEHYANKILKYLQIADTSIENIVIDMKENKMDRHKFSPDFENRELVVKKIDLDIQAEHRVYSDNHEHVNNITLPFLENASVGTIKLFSSLPAILDALEQGGTILIDEIENGLHPNLVKILVHLFYDKSTNPKNAQLLCTSHDVSLIETNVRRDQVWVLEKNSYGESGITRLSDVKGLRASDNFARKYLEGIFGKVPTFQE